MRYETTLAEAGLGPVAGVDEAGRGACAGPITIAACILPEVPSDRLDRLDDSKKLSPSTRARLYGVIVEEALAWSVVSIDARAIDRCGIQRANLTGMRRAVASLALRPGYVLTDAWRVDGLTCPHLPVVGGDATMLSIAAASVLAKVTRDRQMELLDEEFPGYGFARHKGYSTKAHLDAVRLRGASPVHRYTYANVIAADSSFRSRSGGNR